MDLGIRARFADVLCQVFGFGELLRPPDDSLPVSPVEQEIRQGNHAGLRFEGPVTNDDPKSPRCGDVAFWASVKDRTVMMMKRPKEPYVHLTVWLEGTNDPRDRPKDRQVACFDIAALTKMPDQAACLKHAGKFLVMPEEELRHMVAEIASATDRPMPKVKYFDKPPDDDRPTADVPT